MEMKQLESFVTACERGSISQAAACMYTTQPNVSKTIRTLEHELGRPPSGPEREGRTAYGLWEDRTGVCEADSEGNGYDLLFSRAG